jgi:hypothetical protein
MRKLKARLKKRVRCASGLLRRCLSHSFGMPSILQAFLNFREFINFCKTHGLILGGGGGCVRLRVELEL